MSVKISPNLPANVVEIGQELAQATLDGINNAESPSAGNPMITQSALTTQIGGFIGEAPTDGQQYARQNSGWSQVAAGLTSAKVSANAIALSVWYTYDTGSDWNRTTGITNQLVLSGQAFGTDSIVISDGTNSVVGIPSVISSLNGGTQWQVFVNGQYSDTIVNSPQV